NVVMEKYLSDTTAKWRQFSLPLVGDLTGFGNIDLLYSSHSTANERNVYYWDATDAGSGNATGWTAPASSSNQSKAYSIYSNNNDNGLHDILPVISYTGTYDKSDRSYDIKATVDPASSGTSATGWNLIGNPYPSNYDLSTLFSNWPGNVSYKAVHVWDAVNGQYVAILGSGASIQSYNTSGGSNSSTVLAPFQAFWVKANNDVTFSLSNSYRTTSSTGLGTFLKKELDLARLDLFTADSSWDQTVVYFSDAASSGFDPGYDAYKLISMDPDAPSLYAVNADGIFSVTGLNNSDYIYEVPLGIRSKKTGQMSIKLNDSELDSKWYVYLEDKKLNLFYNLKANPYQFTLTENSDSRFVLHLQTYALSNGQVVNEVDEMHISSDGNKAYVYVPSKFKNQPYRIHVIDLMGREVYSSNQLQLNSGMNTLNLSLPPAYYIIRIEASEGVFKGKVSLK
ncbi:MAG: T9SS type A sorting domain-containing protein, partial [Bacteroidetes bacterium]|nr:T9SS type A sorting domain-containing protein [Bacteroidota bacterium]